MTARPTRLRAQFASSVDYKSRTAWSYPRGQARARRSRKPLDESRLRSAQWVPSMRRCSDHTPSITPPPLTSYPLRTKARRHNLTPAPAD